MEITTKADKGMFPITTTEKLTDYEKANLIQVIALEPGDGSGMKILISVPELWEKEEVIKYNEETKETVLKTYPIFDEAMNKELLIPRVLTMLGGLSGMQGVPKNLAWQIVLYFLRDEKVPGLFSLVKVYRGVAGQKGSTFGDLKIQASVGMALMVPYAVLEQDKESAAKELKEGAEAVLTVEKTEQKEEK